ncbi:hypothetical protein ACO0LB_12255 [Undibacterium sp. SXout7W]|uniref:hypothetical protein n=1 Tax=Undibacterium sp. SXout7W TaxID=3413049 RepID=UPI003BF002B6
MKNSFPFLHSSHFFRSISVKKVSIAAALTMLSASNAMAFSEEKFHTAFTQLVSVAPANQQQRIENAVNAWLHQDYINSLQQAEIDASARADANTNLAALETFRQLLAQDPGNALLMSYTGAATAKAAQYRGTHQEKMQLVNNGMSLLDQALQAVDTGKGDRMGGNTADTGVIAMHGKVPVRLEVRFVAANTFLALPPSLHQHARGGELLETILNDTGFAQAGINFQGAVWMQAAVLAVQQHRDGDARHWLNQILEQKAPQTDKATAMLQTF